MKVALSFIAGLVVGSVAVLLYSLNTAPETKPSPAPVPLRSRPPENIERVQEVKPDREVVPPTVAATNPAAQNPQIDLGPRVREAIFAFGNIARKRSINLPKDLELPAEKNAELLAALQEMEERMKALQATRQPIINQIVDEKRASGRVEHPAHPQLIEDPKAQREATRALIEARKPTREGQIVIVGGAGPRIDIFRIDEDEDARLPGFNEAMRTEEDNYFNRVALLFATAGVVLDMRR